MGRRFAFSFFAVSANTSATTMVIPHGEPLPSPPPPDCAVQLSDNPISRRGIFRGLRYACKNRRDPAEIEEDGRPVILPIGCHKSL